MNRTSSLPALIERFFTERLMRQQQASPHTIASYRDTFRLLLGFASQRRKTSPSELELRDLDYLPSYLIHRLLQLHEPGAHCPRPRARLKNVAGLPLTKQCLSIR